MRLVTAIVRPFKLEEVRAALADLGIGGMTVTEVFGSSQGGDRTFDQVTMPGISADRGPSLAPRMKIEIVVDDGHLDQVIEMLQKTARTGKTGDGKIFTVGIGSAMRIRTGEVGPNAI